MPDKIPGEKCSVVEEVSLLTQMRLCNNEAQVSLFILRICHLALHLVAKVMHTKLGHFESIFEVFGRKMWQIV